jgi:hypothetical protein
MRDSEREEEGREEKIEVKRRPSGRPTARNTCFAPSPSVFTFPSSRIRRPMLAANGGCDRSDIIVRYIDEVLEKETPEKTDKAT